MQSLGGILMGLVIKYTDNIIKSFAASITIIFTFFLSYMMFDISIGNSVFIGTYVIVNSILLYNLKIELILASTKIIIFEIAFTLLITACYVASFYFYNINGKNIIMFRLTLKFLDFLYMFIFNTILFTIFRK
jgi:hypothetical protein